ncbi:MAG: translational GTPase TypA [Clostridia bacterium]|nr:translational GTPase TypA [Clostridia bacterium]
MQRLDVRNIAIIAHVDHGKTTMVDQLLKQNGIFRSNEVVADRVMDSNDIERERGITILAKNTAVHYKGTKINIIDTPGHADFGGEVERILSMVDGVLLLVDAIEGCMPQTRYVLKKALGLGKKVLVVVNKVDKGEFDELELTEQIMELFMELGATDEQFDFKIIFASAKQGWASTTLASHGDNMAPLLDAILSEIPAPVGEVEAGLQLLLCNIDYDEYIGRIGIGKVNRGTIKQGQQVIICRKDNQFSTAKISRLYQFEGLKRVECTEGKMGDIVAINGINEINIGETLCDIACVEPLPFVNIDEPTISMLFMVNNSPFAGREGKYVTSRHLRARLFREVETNVSMRVEETDSPDCFKVYGRGELHLSILIENMRREGYEFQVSRPKVIFKDVKGVKCEPIEYLVVEIPEPYVGSVMNKLGARKGELLNMMPDNQGSTRLEFKIPSRCLIGYRSELLTDTKGFGVMSSVFDGYEPYKGDIQERQRGSCVAFEDGVTTAYGLFNAQERCKLFVDVGLPVYAGMVVGENSREDDLSVNVCKTKHLTNNRASGSEEALKLTPPTVLSLEQCLEFIGDDEYVEVTPTSIRLRKAILDHATRMRIWARENKK